MKTKILKHVREKFLIEHIHHPYMMYRLFEYNSGDPLSDWSPSEKAIQILRRIKILDYCRKKYKK